jgi:hypothetical protein
MLKERKFTGSRHSAIELGKMYENLISIIEVDSATWRIIFDDGNEEGEIK